MAEGSQFPSPIMRTAACFHDQLGGRELLEEGRHLGATEIGLQYISAGVIDAVKGEDSLGRVDADALNLGHGRLRSWFVTTQLWHSMPWGRPSQQPTENRWVDERVRAPTESNLYWKDLPYLVKVDKLNRHEKAPLAGIA